jgi:hypothetical protein
MGFDWGKDHCSEEIILPHTKFPSLLLLAGEYGIVVLQSGSSCNIEEVHQIEIEMKPKCDQMMER